MITTMDLNRNVTAVLENAYDISYDKVHNELWFAEFSLPLTDPKNKKVKQLQYVEIIDDTTDEYIGLFRVMPKLTRKNDNNENVTYTCEHVLGVLIGSTLFKYHQVSNYTTEDVIRWLLDQQKEKHWQLGEVEITRYFHYSWENENLLSALFSVPLPFDENYRWTWDTQSYPWTLNLKKVDVEPSGKIIEGYNLVGLEIEENPNSLWNRIYPLGAGEGVNQLDITEVNNGVPYVEDADSIDAHGLYETTWADQRFTDAESLKSTAQKMLDAWSKPIASWVVSAADLSIATGLELDKLRLGKIVRVTLEEYGVLDLLIVKEAKSDMNGNPSDIELELGNLMEDQQDSNVNTEKKQQINELYSQGATNIINYSYQDNADADIPANIPFYLDSDVVNINTCELTFRTKRFRAYSQATEGGGAIVESTSSGGGTTRSTSSGGGTTRSTTSGGETTQTTTSGGSVSTSTASGGNSTQTSSSGGGTQKSTASGGGTTTASSINRAYGDNILTSSAEGGEGRAHYHTVYGDHSDHSHSVSLPSHTHSFSTPDHTHSVSVPSHAHNFEIPNHSHSVAIPAHDHSVTIPNHSHDVVIPDHSHEITIPNHVHQVAHKITELTTMPSSVEIRVDGNLVPESAISQSRLNIVDYLSKDSRGKIERGNHEIEIKPDGLARIEADLILRVFIQSQLGGNY